MFPYHAPITANADARMSKGQPCGFTLSFAVLLGTCKCIGTEGVNLSNAKQGLILNFVQPLCKRANDRTAVGSQESSIS